MMTPFDEAMTLHRAEGGWQGETDPRYRNMIGPYGGWVAAILLRAILNEEPLGQPLSLTVNFIGPMSEGAFAVRTRNARRNRSTDFWSAELVQADAEGVVQVCAQAMAILGNRRDTESFADAVPPRAPAPEELPPVRRVATPFLEMYEFRFAEGIPFRPNADSRSVHWVRDNPARPLDYPSLAALCDSPMPRIFLHSKAPSPLSTISMNVYFHGEPADLAAAADGHLLFETTSRMGRRGFYDQLANVWSRDGRLLATTEQLVWYKGA